METVSMLLPPGCRPEDLLVFALDALAAETPVELPEPVALQRTRVLLAQSERLKTLGLQALADVDSRGLHASDGAPTMNAWVRAQDLPGVDAKAVTLARRLRALPILSGELLAGRLSGAAAAAVGAAVAKARPFLDRPDGRIDGQSGEAVLYGVIVDGISSLLAEQTGGAPADDPEQCLLRGELETLVASGGSQRDRFEAALVLLAQRCEPGLLRACLGQLVDALLPEQHDARARAADEAAGLDLRRKFGGSGWSINGDLDDECGELLDTVLRAQLGADPAGSTDTDAWRPAADQPDLTDLEPQHWPATSPRPRSRSRQRHDALREALRELLDHGVLGTRDKSSPHLVVTVGLDFLHGVSGALPTVAASGARWSREQTRRLLCRSSFTRIVLDAGRRVVEVSHTQRTLKAIERLILHVQWGGTCSRAGCTRGPSTGDRLVPHHVNPFSHAGTTSVGDAVPLCEQDHHYLHTTTSCSGSATGGGSGRRAGSPSRPADGVTA